MNTTAIEQQNDALTDFIDEGVESLRGLPAQLDAYRSTPTVADPINAVFRAVHSIKGCAAFLGLDAIRAFSHGLENTLDVIRTESIPLHDALEHSLVEGFDRLDALLQEALGGKIATELQPEDLRILESTRAAVSSSPPGQSAEVAFFAAIQKLADHMDTGGLDVQQSSQELRKLLQDYASRSNPQEPEALLPVKPTPGDYRDTRFACGDLDVTARVVDILQFFFDFAEGRNGPEREHEFSETLQRFATLANRNGFVELEQALQSAVADFRIIHESPLDFDDNLISLIWDHLAPALEKLKITEHQGDAGGPQSDHALTGQQAVVAKSAGPESAVKSRFVRVKEEHLDTFLEHVSRMFITSERFRDLQLRMAQTRQLPELADELRQINMDLKVESTALQHGVMSLRRVSISGLFSKFPRMARELASQLGKQIHVHLSGEETEIDKQLAEDLDAPLTHLVRNVLDHAIETPAHRTACRKGETGSLNLEAHSTRNQVTILIRDDGRGMDPLQLREKAVEKGILSQAQADGLSNEDALQLIFRPGFSTAEQVSEVSGRGVGMDVVQSTVQQHRGQVSVESAVGQGTTIRLEFPVRQATLVIDGLMVAGGTKQFVIPFENIKEIIRVEDAQCQSVHGRPVVTIRNSTYDAVHLGKLMGTGQDHCSMADTEMAVVVQCKHGSLCIRVDHVVGHRQVVVTALNEIVPDSTKLTGIAQLGGNRLAPVLNIPEIVKSLV
jgi:two-component system chemotaxis sensor kinase CheA